MSDALTDIARDERRAQLYADYLQALRVFLQDQTPENKEAIMIAAAATDQIRRGFHSSRTNLVKKISETIDLLVSGDKGTWAKLLFNLMIESDIEAFKALSPFAGKMLLSVDYGCGFVRIGGDIEPFLNRLIGQDKNLKTYDGDEYLVVMDQPNISDAEVHWLYSGIVGVDGPRKNKNNV